MPEQTSDHGKNLVLMGRIGAAHGIKGALRVKSFTSNPVALGDYGPLKDRNGAIFTVKKIRPQKSMTIVHFLEVTNRNMAETLNGVELFVPREALPANLDEDEFYIEDLVGMDVFGPDDEMIGSIIDMPNFGAGDMLEIAPKDRSSDETYYIAFTRTNVPHIDFENKSLKIVPPTEISERDVTSDGGMEGNEQK